MIIVQLKEGENIERALKKLYDDHVFVFFEIIVF